METTHEAATGRSLVVGHRHSAIKERPLKILTFVQGQGRPSAAGGEPGTDVEQNGTFCKGLKNLEEEHETIF